ncbi:MAG: hypothetical protein H0Z35_08895 [Thermoanaerobacteraceae bacterium]|nr:hypothetical protein [Thermoanaerobacteraceae bacterium]
MTFANLTPFLASLYMSLPAHEKQLWQQYGSYIEEAGNATYLRILAANLIPHGHHNLARKLLHAALTANPGQQEKAWIYANLYQIAADSNQPALSRQYCEKVLETGYLTRWASKTIATLK